MQMNKAIAGLLLGLGVLSAPAYAADVTWEGDAAVKFEQDTQSGGTKESGLMYSLRLTGIIPMNDHLSLYGRLGAQYATRPALSDYNLDSYGEDRKSVIAIDQFGLNYTNGGFSYKLGRQDLTIGTTALLYSRNSDNVGRHNFVDGLTFTGKAGKVDLAGVFVQEDNEGSQDNKLIAIHGGYDVSERLNVGATLGRYFYADSEAGNTNHWAVDSTYKVGKNTFTAELAKSNGDGDNKAYAVTWNYDFNDKTSAYITAFRVEPNADMGGQSDFDNNSRGFKYGIAHKLTDRDTVTVDYTNQKTLRDSEDTAGGLHNTKFEAAVTHTF